MTVFNKLEVIKACKVIEPNPEHGAGQYRNVINYLIKEEPSFSKMNNDKAVEIVMSFMGM